MINASLVKRAMWNSSAIAWNIGRFLPVKTLKYSGQCLSYVHYGGSPIAGSVNLDAPETVY
jgi:hypothetical protein